MNALTSPPRTVLLLAAFGFIVGCGAPPSKNSTAPSNPAPAALGTPDFKLSAEDFTKEFIADEKAANTKYTNKVVQLDGVVQSTGGWNGGDDLTLKGAKKSETDVLGLMIVCHIQPADVKKAVIVGKGQKVQIVGKFLGGNSFGLALGDSTFKELEPSKVPTVSAVDLTGEFIKDAKAAETKYGDKDIIVEGTIADLTSSDGFQRAILAGTAPAVVSCTIGKADFDALKKGDKVKIKGDVSSFSDNKLTVNTAFVIK